MSNDRLDILFNMLEQSPDDAFLMFAIAKEREKRGEGEEALAQFETLRQRHPDYVGLYYHLGRLEETLRDHATAAATYRRGISVARAAGDAHAASELMGALCAIDPDCDDDPYA